MSLAPATVVVAAAATPQHPAAALVDRGAIAMRSDPDASRRDAEAALALLRTHPDADLEIRARLLLCDHQSGAMNVPMRAVAAIRRCCPHIGRDCAPAS